MRVLLPDQAAGVQTGVGSQSANAKALKRRIEMDRAICRLAETPNRPSYLFTQFRTENRYTLFLELL
ncbi:hypothetical protein [Mesorhizobium sp. WSM4884]|uniref:hypothetical protein n=1 Tax=Mesorhizobium sp. WSM4884 TaxID=3038542 RepID=UPI00241603C5|nr:hypothetical protein [Mesorhizobium sp. WSM4884]MDG4879973.1 hypothetical protein [Mesorhizobium sp. WSM4884]